MKVLHIEDDADIREIAKVALEIVGGHELRQCAEGESAVEAAAEFRPDVFLIDVNLPRVSGPEILRRIRALPEVGDAPAIFMTAKALPNEISELEALGAIGVIVKPFDPMGLPAQLETMVARAKEH
ncbi:MAG: response regulator [Alphaproteobacteria bacterium]|nr:MAG: response regulator [Alphaproteobacteria bacterium]